MSSNAVGHMRDRAERRSKNQTERRRRLIKEGKCADCGEPRGDGGSRTKCKRHGEADRARSRAWYQRQKAADVCVVCGKPRGDDGTPTMCREDADALAKRDDARRQRRAAAGICPDHKTPLRLVKQCPTCRYEGSGGDARYLTFEGLLPPPTSGDSLESCVGCERCGWRHHAGSSYYHPQHHSLPKTKIHVGEEGFGVVLDFTDVDEHGQILALYEACSAPGRPCTKRVTKKAAFTLIWAYRRRKRVSGMCGPHARNPVAIVEITEARLQQKLEAVAQAQNPDVLKDGGAEKSVGGRQSLGAKKALAPINAALRVLLRTYSPTQITGNMIARWTQEKRIGGRKNQGLSRQGVEKKISTYGNPKTVKGYAENFKKTQRLGRQNAT
jgi:hypothetical protein